MLNQGLLGAGQLLHQWRLDRVCSRNMWEEVGIWQSRCWSTFIRRHRCSFWSFSWWSWPLNPGGGRSSSRSISSSSSTCLGSSEVVTLGGGQQLGLGVRVAVERQRERVRRMEHGVRDSHAVERSKRHGDATG